jgi:hypothetical protein
VIALGGNALLQRSRTARGRHPAAPRQGGRRPTAAGHRRTRSVHLPRQRPPDRHARQRDADLALGLPFPLDTLGAQTQGIIGYWLAQELANAGVTAHIAVVLTQTLVDPDDPAFSTPTTLIGPSYTRPQAEASATKHRPTRRHRQHRRSGLRAVGNIRHHDHCRRHTCPVATGLNTNGDERIEGSEPRRLRGIDMRTITPTQAAVTPARLRVLESARHGFAGDVAHDEVEVPPLVRPQVTKDATAPSFAQTSGQHR